MSSAPKKTQNTRKIQQTDDPGEEPIPFLVYNSNTRSNQKYYLYNKIIFFYFNRIYFNISR